MSCVAWRSHTLANDCMHCPGDCASLALKIATEGEVWQCRVTTRKLSQLWSLRGWSRAYIAWCVIRTTQEAAQEEEPEKVNLTTIHQAKGLEWPVGACMDFACPRFWVRAIMHVDPHPKVGPLP